jgi:hypothetical protein
MGCHPERHPVTPSAAVCVDVGLVFSLFYCAAGSRALLSISQLGSHGTASHKTKAPHRPGDGEAEGEGESDYVILWLYLFCFRLFS